MFNRLYKKSVKQWSGLSKKRQIFYFVTLSLLLIIIAVPSSVKAGIFGAVASLLGIIIGQFITFLSKIITLEINIFAKFAQFNNFLNVTAVQEGWKLVRDVCNMFFILILLMISFATILKIESYAYKKWLGKLVIAAILINFSKTITGFLIGFSQVVMLTFVSAFKDAVAGNLGQGLHLNEMMSSSLSGEVNDTFSGSESLKDDSLDALAVFGALLLALILLTVFVIVMLIMIVVLVGRIVSLWVLVILSPVAYLLQASPFGSKYAKQWWQELGKNLVSGPVLAFFLWLAFLTIQRSSGRVAADMDAAQTNQTEAQLAGGQGEFLTGISKTTYLMDYIVTIALLMAAIKLTQEMGVIGSSFAGKMQQGMSKFASKAVKGSTLGLAGYLDRKQATKTKIQFAKIPGNIKEGLRLRKDEEERSIRSEAGELSAKGGGLVSLARGYAAGPEAAQKLWFKGFLGIKSMKDTARIIKGGKGAYRDVLKTGEDQGEDLKKDATTNKEMVFNFNFKDKADKMNSFGKEIKDLEDEKEILKKDAENLDPVKSAEKLAKAEEIDQQIRAKKEEAAYFMEHSMVADVSDKDDNHVLSTETENTVEELKNNELKEVKKEYDEREGKINKNKEGLPEGVKTAKLKALEAERAVRNSQVKGKYAFDKNGAENNIKDNLNNQKTADLEYLTSQRDAGTLSEDKYNKAVMGITEDGDGKYEHKGQGEDYVKFLAEVGKKTVSTIQYAQSHGQIEPEEAEKKIKKVQEMYGLNDKNEASGEEPGIIADIRALDNGKVESQISKKYKEEEDYIEKSNKNLDFNKNKIVDNLKTEGFNFRGLGGDDSIENIIKNLESTIKGLKGPENKERKEALTKQKSKLEDLVIKKEENQDKSKIIDTKKKTEISSAQKKATTDVGLEGINEASQLLKQSLSSLAGKIEKISVPKSLSARIADRSLVEEKKKEFSGIDDADELISYLKSAVNNKETYKTRAILEKMAADGNDNEFLNDYGYTSNAIGMEGFRRDVLQGELNMGEQSSLKVMSDLGYINERVGHWETARLVNTDSTGQMSSKVKERADGSWDDTDHAIECFTEISKMNGRAVLNTLNRLAYGGERPNADGTRSFEISNLGKMVLTMLSNDKELLTKRGSELNINAAQNFMDPNSKGVVEKLLGKNSSIINTIKEVSGEARGTRADYQSIMALLKSKNIWS
jgi:hypothetical protein